MAKGNVYFFNTTNQKIRAALNDNPLPLISPAQEEGGNYQASYIRVERSDATSIDDPVFAQNNALMIMFSGVSNHYTVSVNPATSSSNNDLLLYIFYGSIVLVDAVTNTVLLNTPSS